MYKKIFFFYKKSFKESREINIGDKQRKYNVDSSHPQSRKQTKRAE